MSSSLFDWLTALPQFDPEIHREEESTDQIYISEQTPLKSVWVKECHYAVLTLYNADFAPVMDEMNRQGTYTSLTSPSLEEAMSQLIKPSPKTLLDGAAFIDACDCDVQEAVSRIKQAARLGVSGVVMQVDECNCPMNDYLNDDYIKIAGMSLPFAIFSVLN